MFGLRIHVFHCMHGKSCCAFGAITNSKCTISTWRIRSNGISAVKDRDERREYLSSAPLASADTYPPATTGDTWQFGMGSSKDSDATNIKIVGGPNPEQIGK